MKTFLFWFTMFVVYSNISWFYMFLVFNRDWWISKRLRWGKPLPVTAVEQGASLELGGIFWPIAIVITILRPICHFLWWLISGGILHKLIGENLRNNY